MIFLFNFSLFFGNEKKRGGIMTEIHGQGPIGPREIKRYEQEYKHGADLFERSACEYAKSNNPFQQAEFKDVMDKAMEVLNETARGLKREELMKQNQQIEKDYERFQKDPTDELARQQLVRDLEKAKKSVR